MAGKNLNNKLVVVLIFISLLVIVLLYRQNQNLSKIIDYEKGLETGDKAYLFEIADLNGNTVSIESKNSLLIFFNSTCEACEITAPRWQELYEKYSSDNFMILAISTETDELAKQFASQHRLTLPIIVDPIKQIREAYLVKFSPQIVLVNEKGRVIYYQKRDKGARKALSEVEKIIQGLQTNASHKSRT